MKKNLLNFKIIHAGTDSIYYAITDFISYTISIADKFFIVRVKTLATDECIGICNSLDDAKKLAQEDFEFRVDRFINQYLVEEK